MAVLDRTERFSLLMMRKHVCAQLIDIIHLDFMGTPQGGHQKELNYCQNKSSSEIANFGALMLHPSCENSSRINQTQAKMESTLENLFQRQWVKVQILDDYRICVNIMGWVPVKCLLHTLFRCPCELVHAGESDFLTEVDVDEVPCTHERSHLPQCVQQQASRQELQFCEGQYYCSPQHIVYISVGLHIRTAWLTKCSCFLSFQKRSYF